MNIAIFGGSFDPPHKAHETIAYLALTMLPIEKLIVVPTYLNPFKENFYFDPEFRFELLNDLFCDSPEIIISDYEIKEKRKTPTIETLNHLKHIYNPNKIYLIIGSDNLQNIHLWYNFSSLKEMVIFVVVTREGYKIPQGIDSSLRYEQLPCDIPISSSMIRQNLMLHHIPEKIQHKVKKIWKIE